MRIFISYRRNDTQSVAAHLASRLKDAPGISGVFLDVEGIEPGEPFPDRLKRSIQKSNTCLVLIGREWTGLDQANNSSRIMQAGDFVRKEVASAIAQQKRVIPILVEGASMPEAAELPDDVVKVRDLNALFLRHASFEQDVSYILDRTLGRKPGGLSAFFRRRPLLAACLKAFAGVILGAALLLVGALLSFTATREPLEDVVGGMGGIALVAIACLLLGLVSSFWIFRRKRISSPK
jgi:hypothetical protein